MIGFISVAYIHNLRSGRTIPKIPMGIICKSAWEYCPGSYVPVSTPGRTSMCTWNCEVYGEVLAIVKLSLSPSVVLLSIRKRNFCNSSCSFCFRSLSLECYFVIRFAMCLYTFLGLWTDVYLADIRGRFAFWMENNMIFIKYSETRWATCY